MNTLTKLISALFIAFILISCSGGGSGTDSSNSNTINLVAAPVNGATCTIFYGNNFRDASQTTVAGSVSFTGFTHTGPALIRCTGGTYTDEATAVANTALSTLTAAVNLTQNGNYAVTPLTHMAVQIAMSGLGNINDVLNAHNPNIADQFGLEGIDITTTLPTDLSSNPFTGSDNDKYGLILAVISQIGVDTSKTLDTVISETVTDMVADAFLSTATTTSIKTAVDNLRINSQFNASFTATVAEGIKTDVGRNSNDTIPPIIRLDSDTTEIEYGSIYVDTPPAVIDNSGEAITVTTTGTVGTDVGTYTLTYTAQDSSGNVAIIRTITITKKLIVVAVNSINKDFGGTDPMLTYEVTGLVGSDTLTGVLMREAGEKHRAVMLSVKAH